MAVGTVTGSGGDPLPGLIALARCEKAGARDDLLAYLFGQVRRFVRLNVTHKNASFVHDAQTSYEEDCEDLVSEVTLRLIQKLPDLLITVDLQQNPRLFIWRAIRFEWLKMLRDEDQPDVSGYQDYWRTINNRYEPEPVWNVARREEMTRAVQAVLASVPEFRFKNYRLTYTRFVRVFLKNMAEHGTQWSKGGKEPLPPVVKAAMHYWFRKSLRWGWGKAI